MSTVTATSAKTASAASSSSSAMLISGDEFLKILVAQLEHQDPLNPTDANQFVTELAQLSQVQYMKNIDSKIENLNSAVKDGTVGQLTAAIGGYMQVDDTSVSSGDKVLLIPSGDYDQVTLTLKDSNGTTTTKTYSSDDSLIFNPDAGYTITGATASLGGQSVGCSIGVYRYIAGIQSSGSGALLTATDGKTYAASDVKLITK